MTLQDAIIDLLLRKGDDEDIFNVPSPIDRYIYVEPPECEFQSPEDSGNEGDEEGDMLHLPGT